MASTFRKLCPVRDFLLYHDRPSDFVHSMWFASPLPYAVWASCVSVHTVTMAVYSGVSSAYKEKILIWLTYWSFFTLTARFLLTALNAWKRVLWHRRTLCRHAATHGATDSIAQKREQEGCEMPILYKAQWVLQNVSSSAAFIVTGLYWVVMYNPNKTESARSINSHALNSVLVLADLLVSRAPVRIHHFVHTFCYITLYILFSLLYWVAGGTNHLGDSYIYALLNYGAHPGRAVAVVLAVDVLGTPLMQIVLYALFRLRQWVWARCAQRTEPGVPPADVQVSNAVSQPGSSSKTGSEAQTKGGEKDISLEENLHDFRGRNYTLTSNKDEADVVIDVDMDFEMDEARAAVRPPLQTNSSQVSCTDSTQALLT